MIPRIVHQTWKTTNIPRQFQQNVAVCQQINSTYTFKLWTDTVMNEFVLQYFPAVYPLWKSYPYAIQRVDTFRYMVLYVFGGVYIDLDLECKFSFDKLLGHDLVLPIGLGKLYGVFEYFTNEFMMVTKNHPFMLRCIQRLEHVYKNTWKTGIKHFDVFRSTGPAFITNMVKLYKPNVYILKREVYAGDCNTYSKNNCEGGRFLNHHEGGTWHNTWFEMSIHQFNRQFHFIMDYIYLVLVFIFLFYFQKKISTLNV